MNISLELMTLELCDLFFRDFQPDSMMYEDISFLDYSYDYQDVLKYFDKLIHSKEKVEFAIMYENKVAGSLKLKHINKEDKSCELGIHLTNDSFKNKGIGSEAERLAINYAFDVLHCNIIYANTSEKNKRSQRVLEKNGFIHTHYLEGNNYFVLKRPFFIRVGTQEDYKGKAFVHYQSWIETYTGLMPDEYLSSRSLEKNEKTAYTYYENNLIAIADKKIVGFACYLPEARDFVSVKPAKEIVALYVLQDYQNIGIGSTLMTKCLEILNSRPIILFVLDKNEKAIEFYKKKGFEFTGNALHQDVPGGQLIELEMILRRK